MICVNSVIVNPKQVEVFEGKWAYACAQVLPANATYRGVRWYSANPSIASVNEANGNICGISPGTTTIYATAIDGSGRSDSLTVTVKKINYVEKITLDKEILLLLNGESVVLNATISPENATSKAVRWSSSDSSIAYVNTSGRVFGRSAGIATITAEARDGSGVQASCGVMVMAYAEASEEFYEFRKNIYDYVADPVDVYSGAHVISNTLMTLFGGRGLKLVADYNSTKLAHCSMGKGWHHNYEKHIEINSNEALVYDSPVIYARYVSDDYYNSTEYTCGHPSKQGYVLTVDHTSQYPYVLDCNSEMTEYYNACGELAKVVDHEGFETLIENCCCQTIITDCTSGKKMYLEKDGSGKITRVYDDAGRQTVLTYDGDLLTSICDVNGNTITYTYDSEGRIKTGTDSKGTRYFENTYDEYGRVCEQKDGIAGSAKSVFTYDGLKRITTNRNGKQSIREYDCDGKLIKYIDENGNCKTFEHDERGNITKEIDADGNLLIKVYNCFNKPEEIIDKNCNKTYISYDDFGNVTKVRYPAINGVVPEETFVYNDRNQMIQHTDVRGTVTVYTYDANGMPASKKVGNRSAITYSYQNGLLKSQTDAMGNTTRYAHNALGQVSSMTDADNKVTQYVYDNIGNVLRTTDPNGKSIINTYDGNYQKTSVTDANGNKTEYSYNGNMKNTVVTLPDGNTIRYEYDGEDRQVKITDQANNITNITYDDAGRMISKRFADGAVIQYEYDKVGNVVKEINPKGAVTTKCYDKLGNVVIVTDDECNTTEYEYNAMSKVTKVINAVAGATRHTYSAAGDLLSETDPLGNTKTYTYDAFGNRLTVTDAKNNVTTYTYDQNNNLLTVKDALNNVTTYTYNSLNQCVSVKDAKNNVIQYGYDALGRRTTITDARGNVFTTLYDGNGNVVKTTDAKGNTISETVYNCLNKPLTVTDSMGKATTYTYNALGQVASVTDSLNHSTEYSYNSRGQNTSVKDANNATSTAVYDVLGNITRLAGPLGGATNYTYDNKGRLVSESTVSGGNKSYEYNELNIRKKITNARGQSRNLFYDARGRITGYTGPEGSASYTYDANGNVLTVVDSHGTITRTYDALNRVTSYTDTYGKTIGYEYDSVGNLTKIIYPDNTAVSYAYDANHNLTYVCDWQGRVTSYTYDENNRVIGVTKPDGSITTTVYDNMQRVTSTVERTVSGDIITGFEYIYDDLSRIVEEKVLASSSKICYTYDVLGRVTTKTVRDLDTNAVISTENYSYDAAGNVVSAPDGCYTYDTNNRLTVFDGYAVSYDLDGNMLSNGKIYCTYDSANRLTYSGGISYTYNAEDVRIRAFSEEEDTTYTYDTNCKLSKLLTKTTNGVVTKYVYGKGLIGEESGDTFKTYHFDCRGSTVAITGANGNVTDTFAYDTYGKLLTRTGTSNVIFGYNGRDGVVTDGNGLVYMRARYYSPDMRRFVNADIVAGKLSNAITLNRFAYANGNPVSFVDPFGLSAERDVDSDENHEETISQNIILVLYDPYELEPAANGEKAYLKKTYNDAKIVMVPIYSKDEFIETWNKYADSPIVGISLIFHGSPIHIYPQENFFTEDVNELESMDADFMRLLSCNGGHKDVENNIAKAFKSNNNIDELYAMDGSLSFYPRNWYLVGHDLSKYEPRLAYKQNRFYEYAKEVKIFDFIPVKLFGFIPVKRRPTGLYLVE